MSVAFDLHNNVNGIVAMTAQTISTDTTTYGADIDMKGYDSLEIFILSGTLTDGAYACSLFSGAAATPTVATPAANQLGAPTFALTDDDTVKRIGYIGKDRYVRLGILSSSTSSGGVFQAVGVRGNAHHGPVDAQN